LDIVGSFTALVLLALPMVVIAVMLKRENPRANVFYGGMRVGLGGRLFQCWKFRSMEPGKDHLLQEYLEQNPQIRPYWDKYRKLPNDPRVQTRTTKLIRKTSLDELPQLWNVLKGEMSLVGPRPILPDEQEAYGPPLSNYCMVKPGITGLWQVSGRNESSFKQRVRWDIWYVRNWSLWGDIVIILKTIKVVLARSGAS
jgi:lipopolysaccharide/colanic/teichoic acid biosynthesis glycosyltransferase